MVIHDGSEVADVEEGPFTVYTFGKDMLRDGVGKLRMVGRVDSEITVYLWSRSDSTFWI